MCRNSGVKMVKHEVHRPEMCRNVFLHIMMIIIVCSHADSFSVNVPARRLTAARGHSVVLGCVFSLDSGQKPDLSNLVVTWQRQKDNRVVHSYYFAQDQLETQDSAYRNRTALFLTELSKGNASVRLDNVEMKDEGIYICSVSTKQGTDKAELQLIYGAFYTEPRLTINVSSSDILVQYETEGFPEPELMWKGENGKNLSNHVQTSVEPNIDMGLYYIKSSYTAPKSPLNFIFILENQLLHQSLQRPVRYTGGENSCITEVIALAAISSFFLILILVILAYFYFHKKK
ncbi:CD276 antigen [Neoarius graeffei]|uniref:CD276 antigen n=1 Tax=Neoarius graeffei TaxID=443677 RepID=UPI00298BD92B|nr:CD276 antigen [Neoarius graeffei]